MHVRPLSTLAERVGVRIEVRRAVAERGRTAPASDLRWAAKSAAPPTGSVVTARIHPFALLGHQLTSWMAGWLWARDLGLPFGGGEVTRDTHGLFDFSALVTEVPRGLHRVRLPAVRDERQPDGLVRLQARVARQRQPANFQLPVDPFRYRFDDLAGTMRAAVEAGSGAARLRSVEAGPEYIALHIRRPAFPGEGVSRSGTPERWLEEKWYLGVLEALRAVEALRELDVRVYSAGHESEFPGLRAAGVELRLDGARDEDFIDLIGARVLVTAPSSFSFIAGLASRGNVIHPAPWWHAVPELDRWMGVDREATPEPAALASRLSVWLSRR